MSDLSLSLLIDLQVLCAQAIRGTWHVPMIRCPVPELPVSLSCLVETDSN